MGETTRMSVKELEFVKKFCLRGTYPASDERCPYAKAKLRAGFPKTPADTHALVEADAMYLCRYPDEMTPLHKARLISELNRCPKTE